MGGASVSRNDRIVRACMRFGLVCTSFAAAHALALEPRAVDDTQAPQLEVSARSLPHFDAAEVLGRASRIDLSVMSPSRSALGFGVSVNSPEISRLPGPYASAPQSMDFGLRYRYTTDSDTRVDVSAWRRLNQQPTDLMGLSATQDASYGARVEVGAPGPSMRNLTSDRMFLGFQLEGGGRITVKRSGGRPMIYYRNEF